MKPRMECWIQSLAARLKYLLGNKHLRRLMTLPRPSEGGHNRDISDGSHFKNVMADPENKLTQAIGLYLDGVSLTDWKGKIPPVW